MAKYLKINCDGGSRGNPGPAACAFVVYDELDPSTRLARSGLPALNLRAKCGKFLGIKTNNEAEYAGVIEALGYLINSIKSIKSINSINFFLDSSLVVNQINGLFKVKEPRLRELLLKIRELEAGLSPTPIRYSYVPRAQNAAADLLVNETLDSSAK